MRRPTQTVQKIKRMPFLVALRLQDKNNFERVAKKQTVLPATLLVYLLYVIVLIGFVLSAHRLFFRTRGTTNYFHETLFHLFTLVYLTLLLGHYKLYSGVWIAQSVAIVTRLRAGRPGFDSQQDRMFVFPTASRPTLVPTWPPVLWVSGFLRRG
jgi:hypothetical protein